MKTLVHQIEPQQIAVFAAQDCVKSKASAIRSLLNTHHRIMADIRTLLKTMTKVTEKLDLSVYMFYSQTEKLELSVYMFYSQSMLYNISYQKCIISENTKTIQKLNSCWLI